MQRTLATQKPNVYGYLSAIVCWLRYFWDKRKFTAVFLCYLLGACSGHTQIKDDLESLGDRLTSFTGLSLAPHNQTPALMPPSKQTLQIDIERMQINMREFYAIGDCPLGQFVAERNTALGKTHLPSTRFIYERRLLTTLSACMQQLSNKEEIYSKMQSWYQQKSANLPLVWSNMITQSEETYLAFTTAGDYISGDSSDELQATKFALRGLLDSLKTANIDATSLELYLRDLKNARLPARMFRTQKLLQHELPPMTQLLNQYLAQTRCANKKDEEQIKIMRNIFTMFFAEKIQPLASQLNNYQYQLSPYFAKLASHPDLPSEFRQYLSEHYIDSAASYKKSMQDNIQAWQAVFALCDAS